MILGFDDCHLFQPPLDEEVAVAHVSPTAMTLDFEVAALLKMRLDRTRPLRPDGMLTWRPMADAEP